MGHITDGISNDKQVYCCSQCKLFWFWIDEDHIEVRLAVFSPIKSKDCPFCQGINKHIPNEKFLDMQKYQKGEMSFEEYFKKYPEKD